MAGRVKTYNPKEITISLGTHIVTGYGEDSFVTIEANTDGITKKVGCDGEVVRSISPDHTYNISLTLLMTTGSMGRNLASTARFSILVTTSMPSMTSPNTV